MNILVPYGGGTGGQSNKKYARRPSISYGQTTPMEMAKTRLLRKTAFWPLTIGSSVLFSVSLVCKGSEYSFRINLTFI